MKLDEIKKGQKDSNGYTKCWPGKHAEGTKKGKNGGQVRNCVPNESVADAEKTKDEQVPEAQNPRQQSAIAIAIKAAHKKPKNETVDLSKPDHEGGMAISQLKGIADKANELVSMMNQDQQLEAWVQSLITRAETDITDVHDYLKHNTEHSDSNVDESAPKGWEGTVKAMKKHGDEIDNPWALAHWMKNKGYKSHKK